MAAHDPTDFERVARQKNSGLVGEVWRFMAQNKKWWLLPMFAVRLLLAVLALAGSSAAAPFIYTLF